jgi:hypothetical protein
MEGNMTTKTIKDFDIVEIVGSLQAAHDSGFHRPDYIAKNLEFDIPAVINKLAGKPGDNLERHLLEELFQRLAIVLAE